MRAPDTNTIRLFVRRDDLVERWARCGGVADFLARYLVLSERDVACCSTVFNEIVENAAKYAMPGDTPIEVRARGSAELIVIETLHAADDEQVARLERWLAQTSGEEPDVVLERTALSARAASGVGLLTVLRDYRARLSVELDPPLDGERQVRVRVEVPVGVPA